MMQFGSYSSSLGLTFQSCPCSPTNLTANFCILSFGAAWAGPAVTARRLATAQRAAAARVFMFGGLHGLGCMASHSTPDLATTLHTRCGLDPNLAVVGGRSRPLSPVASRT